MRVSDQLIQIKNLGDLVQYLSSKSLHAPGLCMVIIFFELDLLGLKQHLVNGNISNERWCFYFQPLDQIVYRCALVPWSKERATRILSCEMAFKDLDATFFVSTNGF